MNACNIQMPASASPVVAGTSPSFSRKLLTFILRYGVVGTIVVFKVAEWWYGGQNERRYTQPQGLSPPPPPTKPPMVPQLCCDPCWPRLAVTVDVCVFHCQRGPRSRVRMPANTALCPVCRQPRVATTASTAGILFCHKCLVDAVTASPYCPVTGVPCPPTAIRKLFEPPA